MNPAVLPILPVQSGSPNLTEAPFNFSDSIHTSAQVIQQAGDNLGTMGNVSNRGGSPCRHLRSDVTQSPSHLPVLALQLGCDILV